MGKLLKLTWFVTKSSCAGGAVYYSVNEGLWGSVDKSTVFAKNVLTTCPEIEKFSKEYVLDYLPKSEDVNINFGHYWNKGVYFTFKAILNSPNTAVSLKDYTVESITSLIQSLETSQMTEEKKA